jgi:hypothetical protein
VAYSDDTVAGTSSSSAGGVGDADRDASSLADRSRRATHYFDTLVSLNLLHISVLSFEHLFMLVALTQHSIAAKLRLIPST